MNPNYFARSRASARCVGGMIFAKNRRSGAPGHAGCKSDRAGICPRRSGCGRFPAGSRSRCPWCGSAHNVSCGSRTAASSRITWAATTAGLSTNRARTRAELKVLEQLAQGVHAWLQLPGGVGRTNAGVVVDEDGLTVVDTLMVPSQWQEFGAAVGCIRGGASGPNR